MRVLGVTSGREAAAALAIDGVVVAGMVAAPGVAAAGWPSAAVEACLRRANLDVGQLDRIHVVEGGDDGADVAERLRGGFARTARASVASVSALDADAIQTAASTSTRVVLVASARPAALAVCSVEDGHCVVATRVDGMSRLMDAVAHAASALGDESSDPLGFVDRLSLGAEPRYRPALEHAVAYRSTPPALCVDLDAVRDAIGAIAARAGDLAASASLNITVQRARRELAASIIDSVAEALAAVVRAHSSIAALGGDLWAHPHLVTAVRERCPEISIASVPEREGRALGAALSGSPWRCVPTSLAIGPEFTEVEIKHTLDNCRLDYVYEPDWHRLHARVATMLGQGKLVAWFDGPMTFGSRSFGSRSILCDPSSVYARPNINEYLRAQPLDEPLPLMVAPSAASELGVDVPAFEVRDVPVPSAWHTPLVAALDWRRHVRVHGLARRDSPLASLLDVFYQRTGVPALIEVPLGSSATGLAATPRDAIRHTYSSAVDALVLGRLLLMKDYWLLRTSSTGT
jgi:predicted NodU family carbamoyl transferase